MILLKLRHIFLFSVLILSACFPRITRNIHEIYSFKEAQSALDKADSNTLVIFDVDDTLTHDVSVPFQRWFLETNEGKQFLKEIHDHVASKENPQEYDKQIRAKYMLKHTNQPLESIIGSMIKKLQDRGIKIIALTYYMTGGMAKGIIPSLPQWRYNKLKEVGIDFSSSFPEQEIIFSHLTSDAGRHPVYYNGILLTDKFSKGEVLGAFLDKIDWKPGNVIMFDDNPDKLTSVQDELKKRAIPFQGFVYKARDFLPHVIDKAVLEKHLQHLKEHDEIISDKEVRTILLKEQNISSHNGVKECLVRLLDQDFTLETNRLLLKKVSINDIDDIYEFLGDEETHQSLACPPLQSKEDTKNFINETIKNYKNGALILLIKLKSNEKVIGIISLEINFNHNRAELGFVLNKKYWNKGYITEAADKLIEFGFKTLNLNRIQAMCKLDNKNAQIVLKKLGMLHEATLQKYRRDFKATGVFLDVQLWALLKTE